MTDKNKDVKKSFASNWPLTSSSKAGTAYSLGAVSPKIPKKPK